MANKETVTLQDWQIEPYVEFMIGERDKLVTQIEGLIKKVMDIENGVDELLIKVGKEPIPHSGFFAPTHGISVNIPQTKSTKYDDRLSWWEKAAFILLEEKKLLTARGILDRIYIAEPTLKDAPLAKNHLPTLISALRLKTDVFKRIVGTDKFARYKLTDKWLKNA